MAWPLKNEGRGRYCLVIESIFDIAQYESDPINLNMRRLVGAPKPSPHP